MAWKTRELTQGSLGVQINVPGNKPFTSMDISDLITELQQAADKGVTTVALHGLGTLLAGSSVLLATESQM